MKLALRVLDFTAALLLATGILTVIVLVVDGFIQELKIKLPAWWSNEYGKGLMVSIAVSIVWVLIRGRKFGEQIKR
jgi:hypothetical protein